MMFFVHWVYALVNLAVVFLVWFYIGRANPGVAPGVTADFRFFAWLQQGIAALCGYVDANYLIASLILLKCLVCFLDENLKDTRKL